MGFFRRLKRNLERNPDLKYRLEALKRQEKVAKELEESIKNNLFLQKDKEKEEKNEEILSKVP